MARAHLPRVHTELYSAQKSLPVGVKLYHPPVRRQWPTLSLKIKKIASRWTSGITKEFRLTWWPGHGENVCVCEREGDEGGENDQLLQLFNIFPPGLAQTSRPFNSTRQIPYYLSCFISLFLSPSYSAVRWCDGKVDVTTTVQIVDCGFGSRPRHMSFLSWYGTYLRLDYIVAKGIKHK